MFEQLMLAFSVKTQEVVPPYSLEHLCPKKTTIIRIVFFVLFSLSRVSELIGKMNERERERERERRRRRRRRRKRK